MTLDPILTYRIRNCLYSDHEYHASSGTNFSLFCRGSSDIETYFPADRQSALAFRDNWLWHRVQVWNADDLAAEIRVPVFRLISVYRQTIGYECRTGYLDCRHGEINELMRENLKAYERQQADGYSKLIWFKAFEVPRMPKYCNQYFKAGHGIWDVVPESLRDQPGRILGVD